MYDRYEIRHRDTQADIKTKKKKQTKTQINMNILISIEQIYNLILR